MTNTRDSKADPTDTDSEVVRAKDPHIGTIHDGDARGSWARNVGEFPDGDIVDDVLSTRPDAD